MIKAPPSIRREHDQLHAELDKACALPGRVRPDMKVVIPLVDRLKEELPLMLQEHRAIQAALLELERAAGAEGLAEQARFAEALRLHAEAARRDCGLALQAGGNCREPTRTQ